MRYKCSKLKNPEKSDFYNLNGVKSKYKGYHLKKLLEVVTQNHRRFRDHISLMIRWKSDM